VTAGSSRTGESLAVGNDVVDLADPEARLDGLHPRFAARVFTAAERSLLEACGDRQRLHWALWAAKESAYKARKRLEPQTVFSPREFEVELRLLPPTPCATASGRVVHRGDAFDLELQLDAESVHAIVQSRAPAGRRTLSGVGAAGAEPGLAARRRAATAIATALNLDPDGLSIAGRPPVVRYAGRPLDVALSLSHHGRFVAFAFGGRALRQVA
jgi:phosphopantetheinyl transferase